MGFARWPSRFDKPETSDDERKERNVNRSECGLAGFEEHQPMDAVLEERALVGAGRPCLLAEFGFPSRQRTLDTAQRFAGDDANGEHVREPKPEVAHPGPAEESARPHRQQAGDDEHDEGKMDDENDVSEKKMVLRALHGVCSVLTQRGGTPGGKNDSRALLPRP